MLCVDDDDDLRRELELLFKAEDFEVDSASNGPKALEMMKNKAYDIVLLDMKMPEMDGMTVLKEMRKLNVFPHVIMLTAVNDVSTALECIKLGAKDYIQKPYEPEELLHVVIKVLSS